MNLNGEGVDKSGFHPLKSLATQAFKKVLALIHIESDYKIPLHLAGSMGSFSLFWGVRHWESFSVTFFKQRVKILDGCTGGSAGTIARASRIS